MRKDIRTPKRPFLYCGSLVIRRLSALRGRLCHVVDFMSRRHEDDAHFLCAHATVIEALLQTSELYHEVVTYAQNKRKVESEPSTFFGKSSPRSIWPYHR